MVISARKTARHSVDEGFERVQAYGRAKQPSLDEEIAKLYESQDGEFERVKQARELAKKIGLDMHFFAAKIGYQGKQNIFYFTC